MKTVLPSGRKAHVGVKFTQGETLPAKLDYAFYLLDLGYKDNVVIVPDEDGRSYNVFLKQLRGTRIRLTLDEKDEYEARSLCKPPDNFCRKQGRRYAAMHLLQETRDVLSEEDRKALFFLICPEYKKGR